MLLTEAWKWVHWPSLGTRLLLNERRWEPIQVTKKSQPPNQIRRNDCIIDPLIFLNRNYLCLIEQHERISHYAQNIIWFLCCCQCIKPPLFFCAFVEFISAENYVPVAFNYNVFLIWAFDWEIRIFVLFRNRWEIFIFDLIIWFLYLFLVLLN